MTVQVATERVSGVAPGTTRDALEHVRAVTGADIVALYPYDHETDSFYGAIAIGLPEGDPVRALPDLNGQLRRFREDESQGKIPNDFAPTTYGASSWLLARRTALVSPDPVHEVDSSFVRRHHIQGIIGLPLLVGSRTVGLLFLDFLEGSRVDLTDSELLTRAQEAATEVALALDAATHAAELTTLETINDLVRDVARLPSGAEDPRAVEDQIDVALGRILTTTGLRAAAFFVPNASQFQLVASLGCPDLASQTEPVRVQSPEELSNDPTLIQSLDRDDLHLLAALPADGSGYRPVLILADPDALALERRLPIEQTFLQTAANLLASMLNAGHLAASLGETSRTLSAVTRLSTRLLRPGATRAETLHLAVEALTDPELPELNFEFATIFILDRTPDGRLMVVESEGATASAAIDSISPEGLEGRRIPAWSAGGTRLLLPQDVLASVATRRRAVVVAPMERPDDHRFVAGYPEDELERIDVPLTQPDGTPEEYVHAVRLRKASDRAPLRSDDEAGGSYRRSNEFTLDAALFRAHGHASLVRVFVPFGSSEDGKRSLGVLEAGFHISHRDRLERVQIEALRASAATIAGAAETARLYGDVSERARQLQIVTEVSRAIATSIDLEQTLRLVARNMARSVDASICLIALLDEDGSAWYGAAASEMEDVWCQRRVERPERSIIFEVADMGRPVVVEDANNHELVSTYMARLLKIRSLVALPLVTGEGPIGAVVLGQRDRARIFTSEEVDRAMGLASQAAMAIRNARVHAREEEEQHIQKDVVLVGFGQWGQKAYKHLVLLKNFFNFRVHVVEQDDPFRHEALKDTEATVVENGDLFYWDSEAAPAREVLASELEPSCYVITYIATPAVTHLPVLKSYYDLSNVVLIEKPLGAPPEEYREFLDNSDGLVQIVAADHYWFKIEVRLLELLLTEERNLRAFLDEIEEIEVEILEAQAPGGSGAQIGMIADLIPHAFAILSLLTPLDRLDLDPHTALQVGRMEPFQSDHETYARLQGSFDHRGRKVRVTIDVGKGVADAKWIKLTGPRRLGGRRSFYKFDFTKGEAMDGTQGALRAAVRPIRQPGVPDNAHLSMLRHVIEKKHPAIGILSIREALRANSRIREIEAMAAELIADGKWTAYRQGHRPAFPDDETVIQLSDASVTADQPASTHP